VAGIGEGFVIPPLDLIDWIVLAVPVVSGVGSSVLWKRQSAGREA